MLQLCNASLFSIFTDNRHTRCNYLNVNVVWCRRWCWKRTQRCQLAPLSWHHATNCVQWPANCLSLTNSVRSCSCMNISEVYQKEAGKPRDVLFFFSSRGATVLKRRSLFRKFLFFFFFVYFFLSPLLSLFIPPSTDLGASWEPFPLMSVLRQPLCFYIVQSSTVGNVANQLLGGLALHFLASNVPYFPNY